MKKTLSSLLVFVFVCSLAFAKPHETQWSPDTCGCVIVYEWDDELPNDQVVTTFKRAEKVCQHHSAGPANKFLTVLDENQRKNKALKIVMDNFPEITETDADGSKRFKPGMEPSYSFTPGRKLKINPKGLNASQKTQLNTLLDATFPVDKADAE